VLITLKDSKHPVFLVSFWVRVVIMLVSKASALLRLLPIPIVLVIYCVLANSGAYHAGTDSSTSIWISAKAGHGLSNRTAAKSTFSQEVQGFWGDLALALEDARPEAEPLHVENGHPTSQETKFEPLDITKTGPSRLVNFTNEQETALMKSHYMMRSSAQHLSPRLVFSKGSMGIVTTANAKYMPILLVSIRMLRRTGCQLPVEVFIDDWTTYDPYVCEFVLPSLNAACVVLSEVYETTPKARAPTSYQFKLFAMLFSSFQHVLFLDTDAFPAHDPTPLFTTAPYTTHGLVLWPDLFGLTISEHYYHIAGIPYESPSARASTESSIVLLNKDTHRESLLMMVYYNYFGPDYYYPLLCQGSHGAGDKETFVQAAMAVELPWYQVKTGVAGLGYFDDNNYRLSGLAQMDPRTDFMYKPPSKSHIHGSDRWDGLGAPVEKVKPLFVHQNMHKLDPKRILKMDGTEARTRDGKYTRLWGKVEGIMDMFGYDVERRVWEVVIEEGCRGADGKETCAELRNYFTEVFGVTD
jgi:alpha 1,2-mannosyltransferase